MFMSVLLVWTCRQGVVDTEQIIGLELSSLMTLTELELTAAVKTYHDGFKISIVCSTTAYVSTINALCAQLESAPQILIPVIGHQRARADKAEIRVKAARNTYDEAKCKDGDIEGKP